MGAIGVCLLPKRWRLDYGATGSGEKMPACARFQLSFTEQPKAIGGGRSFAWHSIGSFECFMAARTSSRGNAIVRLCKPG